MKKSIWALLIVSLLVSFGMCEIAKAKDLIELEISNCDRERGTGFLSCEVLLFNNSNKFLDYCEATIILMKGEKRLVTKSRPWDDIESNSFNSKTFYFGTGIKDYDNYMYSITRIRFK